MAFTDLEKGILKEIKKFSKKRRYRYGIPQKYLFKILIARGFQYDDILKTIDDLNERGVIYYRAKYGHRYWFIYKKYRHLVKVSSLAVVKKRRFRKDALVGCLGNVQPIKQNKMPARVGFHGTSLRNARKIIREGFNPQPSDEMYFGLGVYLSYEIKDALRYNPSVMM